MHFVTHKSNRSKTFLRLVLVRSFAFVSAVVWVAIVGVKFVEVVIGVNVDGNAVPNESNGDMTGDEVDVVEEELMLEKIGFFDVDVACDMGVDI